LLSSISSIINAFKARVLADGGTFEAESYLLTQSAANINSASFVYIPSSYKTNKLYSLKPTDGSGDLTFARNSVAYRNNASNVLEQMAANVGRVSYINSVPTLLIEPLRTNLVPNSSDVTNASWSKLRITTTNTANTTPLPSITARKLEVSTNGAVRCNAANLTGLTAGTRYVFKQYIKRDNLDTVSILISDSSEIVPNEVTYNFATNTLGGDGIGIRYLVDRTSTLLDNGWVLITIFLVIPTGQTTLRVNSFLPSSSTSNGTAGNAIQVSNVQVEQGTLPTSDIVTGSSAVTRVADVATVTRTFTANSTIFQNVYLNAGSLSDGAVYVLLDIRISSTVRMSLYRFNNTLQIDVINSTTQYAGLVFTLPTLVQNTVYKIAIVTSTTGFKVFVNGGLRYTSGVLSMPNLTSAVMSVGCWDGSSLQYNGSIINVFVEDTNLNDATCIARTT
jgi:hypothetical protein